MRPLSTMSRRALVSILSIFCLLSAPFLRAGSIFTLAESPEYTGHLTLNATAIHVDGASPADISLPDILEADFTDSPFQLDYFSTHAGGSGPLPATWKAL